MLVIGRNFDEKKMVSLVEMDYFELHILLMIMIMIYFICRCSTICHILIGLSLILYEILGMSSRVIVTSPIFHVQF